MDLINNSHFAIDSRKVRDGSLFFALRGEKVDGHSFLEEAATRGGKGAVVSRDYHGDSFGLELYQVENVREALQQLARRSYEAEPAPIIGVTGTVGKTTTKEYIAALLSKKYRVYKTEGSENSQLTYPLTILNRDREAEILVLELGMSEPGELERLVQIAAPEVGVLTKVSLVHAANFDSLEEIAAEKAEMFAKARLAIINEQAAPFKAVQAIGCEKRYYEGEGFMDENLEATRLVGEEFGVKGEVVVQVPHRFERHERGGVTIIDDSYNASPDAMMGALRALPEGRKVGILGAMKELGKFSDAAHREVGEVAAEVLDEVWCVGEECRPIVEACERAGKPVRLLKDIREVARAIHC